MKNIIIALVVVAVIVAYGFVGYQWGQRDGVKWATANAYKTAQPAKVVYVKCDEKTGCCTAVDPECVSPAVRNQYEVVR